MGGIVVWSEGRLRDPDEPLLSALDHGVTVGDGVFETCGVVRGHAFALTRHLTRLTRSAVGIGLVAPDLEAVRQGVAAVLAADDGIGRLRVTVTAGVGPLGSGRLPGRQTVLVIGGPAAPPAPVRAVRVPWVHNERSAVAGLKTTSYAENAVLLAWAKAHGGDEALVANTVGELCEGTGTNVFVERAGALAELPDRVGHQGLVTAVGVRPGQEHGVLGVGSGLQAGDRRPLVVHPGHPHGPHRRRRRRRTTDHQHGLPAGEPS